MVICVGIQSCTSCAGGSTVRYRSGGARSGYKDCCVSWTNGDGAGLRRR